MTIKSPNPTPRSPTIRTDTPERAEILTLLARFGGGPSVDSWTNGNGITCCGSVLRPGTTQQVRIYFEGARSQSDAERAVLGALRTLMGGVT